MINKKKQVVDLGEIYVDVEKDQEALVDFIESLLDPNKNTKVTRKR